nr:class I SAM-dependent methyltransferase [Planctomycetota bacterium]
MRAHRASATARLIARAQILIAAEPAFAHYVPPEDRAMAAACLRAGGFDAWPTWCSHKGFRSVLWRLERALLPGIVLHYALRKRRIAAWVDQALVSGIRQLVVIAAGFDALGQRVGRSHPAVARCELDHPATQALKRLAIADRDPGLRLVPIDLAKQDLSDGLVRAGMRSDERATIVIEGLLMYLDERQVRSLLRQLAQATAPGSMLALTAMTARAFIGGSRAISWWLRRVNEPFRWHVRGDALGALLADTGWSLVELADHRALAGLLRRPA